MGRQLSCVKKSRLSQSYRGRKSREREAEAVIASCNADTCQTNGDFSNIPREAAGHGPVVELQPASSGWREFREPHCRHLSPCAALAMAL